MISAILGGLGVASGLASTLLNQSNFNDQMALSKHQFDVMNRLHDPVHQVNRLRAAGINPAFAYGQIQPGQATASSIPSANPIQPLDLGGLASIAQGISLNDIQARNIESETQKNEQESKGLTIDNLFKKEDWLSKLYGRDSESWLHNKMADVAGLSFQYDKLSMRDRLRELKLNVELKDAQVAAQTISLQYLTPRLAAEVNNLIAQQFVAYATGRSSLTQAHAAIMNATTNNDEMKAKFGADPKSRQAYSHAIFKGLLQERYTSQSEEWKNINTVNPLPYNRYKTKEYFDWRGNNKRW